MRLEDMRGRRYGRYEILDLLGRGGMAAVYRAHDTMLRRDVALKLLYPQYSGDTMLVERFEREAVLAAQLDHPGIVPIYDVGDSNGMVYIAMKLLHGRSLADLLGVQTAIDPLELLPIVDQIASALDYAHARGIIHRDIKPANIILEERSADGPAATTAVLTDFGIAKSLDSPSMTGTGVLIGTPDYMAPEQIRGDRAIDGRADIYALGALVFRALTGKRPFEGNTQEVLIGHLEGKLPSASNVNPALPPVVDAVIQRAMALRPADRFERASAFAQALRAALNAPAGAKSAPPALHAAPTVPVALPRAAEQPTAATAAATAPGAIAALHQSQRVARPEQRPQAEPAPGARSSEPPRRQISFLALVIAGLVALLGVGLVIGRLSAGGLASRPTATDIAAVATQAGPSQTPAPSATTAPSSTPAPSNTAEPSATAQPSPTTTPTMLPTLQPTTLPTVAPPATRPPTAVPPTPVPATATLAPSPSATATLTPSATPSPSPSPTLTLTPTATPCAISSLGGFALLREQNEQVRTRLGCPAQPIQEGTNTAAEQPFQRGSMLFFDPRKAIWVFVGGETGAWYRFEESSLQDKPTPTPAPPPGDGLYIPERGFGLVWAYNPDIREQLGYATAPEAGLFDGAYQAFTGGTMLYSARGLGNGQTIYVLYSDGTFERYRDPNQ